MKKDSKLVHASGMRKRAVARATVHPGKGFVRVNSLRLESYGSEMIRQRISEPLLLAPDVAKEVDIDVTVQGGGVTTQADAIRLALGRALNIYSKDKLKQTFLDYDRTLLVADIRVKERSKPNCHGKARAKRQKSYR